MDLPATTIEKNGYHGDLQFNEERFRIIIEQTGQIVYDYNVSSGKIAWAGAIQEITGYNVDEFRAFDIGDWESRIHPHDRIEVLMRLKACEEACSPFEVEYRFQRKDGGYIYLEDHGVFLPGEEGAAFRLLGVMSDITARVESQEALRRSEELYRSLVEASSHMVWMADAEGNARMDLKSWAVFTGQNLSELEGRGWTQAIHPEDLPGMLSHWEKSVQVGEVYQHEYRLRRKDGVFRLMAAKAVPVRDSNGKISSWIGTCLDISEQRESERRQYLLEAQLRQSQKMEAIGTLAGGIAHDFNNILMAIMSYGELAWEDAAGNPSQQENIRHILEASDRARDLVKQILSFSRQNRQETRPVRLEVVAKEALKLLKAALSSQIEINVVCEKDLPAILADPIQMQQVILNLCTNSAQALREKGGVIELYMAAVDFSEPLSAERHHLNPGPYVLLRVKDDGVGMDEDTAKRIFDPFFTTKSPGEGTGLGLSVVHGIVKAHQGNIEVRSREGEGTTFELYFPAVYGEDELLEAGESQSPRGSGQKILIVDDEIKICQSVSRALERLGYWVESFVRPVQAFELFEKNPSDWDLVITDLTMPGLTGIQLAEKMHKRRPDLPILLVTGYSGTWTQEQLAGKGIAEMLSKPTSTKNLATAVARVLGKK